MDITQFAISAGESAARNLTENVIAVAAQLDPLARRMRIIYFVRNDVADEDVEACHRTFRELIQRTAPIDGDSFCVSLNLNRVDLDRVQNLVYLHSSAHLLAVVNVINPCPWKSTFAATCEADFQEAAEFSAKSNLTDNISAVTAELNDENCHLRVIYFVNGPVMDDHVENCEEMFGELSSSFPQVYTGEAFCVDVIKNHVVVANLPSLVYCGG